MATQHLHIPPANQRCAAEGILIDLEPSDELEAESTTIASTGPPDFPLPHDLVRKNGVPPHTKVFEKPTWKGHPALIALLGDSWEVEDVLGTNDPIPGLVDVLSVQPLTAPDVSASKQITPNPSHLASALGSPISSLSATVLPFTPQSDHPSRPKCFEAASELVKEPNIRVGHRTDGPYEDKWLPEVEDKLPEIPQNGDQQLLNAPKPPAFKTYADASNHFYTSLDHSALEKPLNCPLSSNGPVVPPSHSNVASKLPKSAPHSVDRPNRALAPNRSVQETLRYAYNIKPFDIIGRKSSNFARGGQIRPSELKAYDTQCDDNLETSIGGEALPIGKYRSEEYTASHVAQSLPSETEDLWATAAAPNWEIPEKDWPTKTQLVPIQFARKREELTSTPDLAHKYIRDPPPHQRARSQIRPGPRDDSGSAHGRRLESKSSAYYVGWGSTTRKGQYKQQASLGNNALAPSSASAVFRSPYITGESGVVSTFDDPAAVDQGWGHASNHDSFEAACMERSLAPELLKPKDQLVVFSNRTSRDPNFVLPPPDEEPPQDRTWDDPEWKSYGGKRARRPLRLPPVSRGL